MAQKTKIIPFDWEYYQANKDNCRVITSHEVPIEVTQLHKFKISDDCSFFGVMNNTVYAWYDNGHHIKKKESLYNLQLEVTEEVVESWVNVYEEGAGKRYATSKVFDTETEALGHIQTDNGRYICTIPLHELKEEGGEK